GTPARRRAIRPAAQDSLMAVAVQPTAESREPKRSPQSMGLVATSVIGAVSVLAAAALVLRGVPWAWDAFAGAVGIHDPIARLVVQVTAQVAVAIGLIYLASRLHGDRPATGSRGATFFMIVVAFTVFFSVKALIELSGRGFTFGTILLMLLFVVLLFLVVQFFRTGRFTEWSIALDQAGWFDAH